jgi:homoisocitrate dehydrogenase
MTPSKFSIALIPGDGIGREVIQSAKEVLQATKIPFVFEELQAGWETFLKTKYALPPETVHRLLSGGYVGAMFGAVSSPVRRVDGYSSPIIALRKTLDLYANLRPVESDDSNSFKKPIRLMIVRENTECLYVKSEKLFTLPDGTKRAVAERVITETASERIGKMAFNLARQRKAQTGSALVTIVHKSNVLSVTDGLFRESVFQVAKEYPDIAVDEQIVDSMVYKLYKEPYKFDVIVAPNLYGDIISDAAAALVGSLGLVPGANVGDYFYLAEPVHGSAPDIQGKGIANPIGAIRSAVMLLNHLGYVTEGEKISKAIIQTLNKGIITPDLGGHFGTKDITQSIINIIS